MYHPEYFAPREKIMELMCILHAARYAVFVVTFPRYYIRLPPTVICTNIGSSLCGCMLTNMREYVTVHPTGILLCMIKQIVFVTLYTFPGNPSVISPNYFDSPF